MGYGVGAFAPDRAGLARERMPSRIAPREMRRHGRDEPVRTDESAVAVEDIDPLLAAQAMRAGALDYLLKARITGELLVRSIRYSIERHRMAVMLAGAAGMYAFERSVPGGALTDYATSLWWTSMIMTTMGSEYWPRTPEGRVLCVLLSLYAFAVFGYVTATLASYFVDTDAERPDAALAGSAAIDALHEDFRLLQGQLRELASRQ